MAADSRYTTIRSQALNQIQTLTLNPKPEYEVDGKIVKWQQYLDQLQSVVEFCDRKIIAETDVEVFELETRGEV